MFGTAPVRDQMTCQNDHHSLLCCGPGSVVPCADTPRDTSFHAKNSIECPTDRKPNKYDLRLMTLEEPHIKGRNHGFQLEQGSCTNGSDKGGRSPGWDTSEIQIGSNTGESGSWRRTHYLSHQCACLLQTAVLGATSNSEV